MLWSAVFLGQVNSSPSLGTLLSWVLVVNPCPVLPLSTPLLQHSPLKHAKRAQIRKDLFQDRRKPSGMGGTFSVASMLTGVAGVASCSMMLMALVFMPQVVEG